MDMTATRIASFENFAALEDNLREMLGQYKESSARYKETLGELMRSRSSSNDKKDEKRSVEMVAALGGEKPRKNSKENRKDKPKMFGSKKEKNSKGPEALADWAAFEPFSVFVGQGTNGMAELYFDAINHLEETASKIQLSIDVLHTLQSRVGAPSNISLIVSFVNDIPNKAILRPASDDNKKNRWSFSFSVPVAMAALPASQ